MGDAGDAFSRSSDRPFSTRDTLESHQCPPTALTYHGAWWNWNLCNCSKLNGPYRDETEKDLNDYGRGVVWSTWKGSKYSLKRTEMKTRRTTNTLIV